MARKSIFLFGVSGYMSVILPALLKHKGFRISGICTSSPPPVSSLIRFRVGRLLRMLGLREDTDFYYKDPFGKLTHPARIAVRNNIPVFDLDMLRGGELAKYLSTDTPDIVLVAGFPKLIPAAVYGQAKEAAVNLHPSLLPQHRGGTPNRWIVALGERKTGITAHFLDASFDTGDILDQLELPVEDGECWGDVEHRILAALPAFSIRVLDRLAGGDMAGRQQIDGHATHEPPFDSSFSQVDWQDSAERIQRKCLAVRPKSGGLTSYGGHRICLWEVSATGNSALIGEPGRMAGKDEQGNPQIICGDGIVTIEQVLYNGRVRPGCFLAEKYGLKEGARLGV